MKRKSSESDPEKPTTSGFAGISCQASANMAHEKTLKKVGKRPGRKPSKIDQKAKLERSRQSARECRARKKLRYQYLEELVNSRERAVFSLREEVDMYKRWSIDLDNGIVPDGLLKMLAQDEMKKALTVQTSPQSNSSSSSPATSPASSDKEHQASQQSRVPFTIQTGRPPGPTAGPQSRAVSSHAGQSHGQQYRHLRKQELTRQPSVHQLNQQALTSMNRGTRSFEENLSSSSSSSSSLYRSGSVPNLASSSPGNIQRMVAPNSTTLIYKEFAQQDNTTLTSTGFTSSISQQILSDMQTGSNIPTVVCQRSPPSAGSLPSAAWTGRELSATSQCRTLPQGAVNRTAHQPHPAGPHTQGRVFSDSCVSSGITTSVAPAMTPSGQRMAIDPPVPYYQRPQSNSGLGRRVTANISLPSSSVSLSQQNLPNLSDPIVTCPSSQGVFSTLSLSESVAAGLTASATAIGTTSVCASSELGTNTSSSWETIPQNLPSVCIGSELSASISEPIPHWYSFLDDLEKATLSARQGAFSEAGTPSSSRTRSGAGTPCSVDSPYSQQQQQQQQQQGSSSDGNIPNIITDLLGQSPPS